MRHFFPDFNDWLQALPDSRDPDAIIYETRFMAWWGLWLYLGQLGSRRQLDFELDADGNCLLDNFNRLADTEHDTRPVHDTLDHFLDHVPVAGLQGVRLQMAQRLCRMKVLDPARLLGHLVLIIDGTGVLSWKRRHCPHCLTQKHGDSTRYMHQVLEAKILGPGGLVVSVGSEFIDNRDVLAAAAERGEEATSAEQCKQDCELKALDRLAPQLKRDFPQTKFVLAGDGLYACGRVLQLVREVDWHFVLTLKEGRLPTVWQEFQTLAPLCPRQRLERQLPDGTQQVYRWVHDLSYTDSAGRYWKFNALECLETDSDGEQTRWAWITDLPLSATTVVEIATKGGRGRWKIENEGFNRQKNSGLNLEHAYTFDLEKMGAYYCLMQMAFVLTQLLERGSLLEQLLATWGRDVIAVLGSLKNIVKRLLEGLRCYRWADEWFTTPTRRRIGLEDTS